MLKRVGIILLLLTIVGAAGGCGRQTETPIPTPTPAPTAPPAPVTFTLSTSVGTTEAGSVSPSNGSYESGARVTLTATPSVGYRFTSWSGDASGTAPTITITMDSDKKVLANFEKIRYTLSTSVIPPESGSISPSSGTFDAGIQVTLTATPASGYQFASWSGDAAGIAPAVTITMNSDKKFVATFVEETPPIISEVEALDITNASVTIVWITDKKATSQVEYGPTTAYGVTSPMSRNLVTSHKVTLSELSPNTTYHFRAKSSDENGNEAVSNNYTFTTAKSPTHVGGIISHNMVWTEENSPYIITETVQIPASVTLVLEPGVTVSMPTSGDMFLLNGKLIAKGTEDKKIVFDGGDNSNFFSPKKSSADTFLDLEYCIIKNGISFWPPTGHEQYGYFNLRRSQLINLSGYSYIWYPAGDVHIEYNKFVNAGGFSVGHSGNVKVYIQYNLFDGKNPGLPSYADFWVQNWAAYDSSRTIVKYNSFINNAGMVLKLPSGYDKAAMVATENYWGTQDTQIIDQFIYDKNDDIT